jgi:hypothetical protein
MIVSLESLAFSSCFIAESLGLPTGGLLSVLCTKSYDGAKLQGNIQEMKCSWNLCLYKLHREMNY